MNNPISKMTIKKTLPDKGPFRGVTILVVMFLVVMFLGVVTLGGRRIPGGF